MNWVKENKKLVIYVGVLVATVFLWRHFVYGSLAVRVAKAADDRNTNRTELQGLSARGAATSEQVATADSEVRNLTKRLKTLRESVEFKIKDKFKPDKVKASVLFDKLRTEATQLRQAAEGHGILWSNKIQGLGFPGGRVEDELASEYLVRLALIYRVVEVLSRVAEDVDSPVREISKIDPMPDLQQRGEVALNPELFLNRVRTAVEFKASGKATFRFLHQLQQPGDFVEIEALSISKEEGGSKEELYVRLTVAALLINEEKHALDLHEVEAKEPE